MIRLEKITKEYYWLYLANELLVFKSNCMSCYQNESQYNHKWALQLFPACRPSEFLAMDIHGPLLNTACEDQYVIKRVNWYLKKREQYRLP